MASRENTAKPTGIEFFDGYQVYSESGIDLTLWRENLRRTVEERVTDHGRGARLAHAMADAGRRLRGAVGGDDWRQIVIDALPILSQLTTHKVECVVIGGLAMRIHGSAHITDDLDVCSRRTPENTKAVAAAFIPLHLYLRGAPAGLPFHFDPPTIQAGLNFTLTTDHGYVNLLGEVSGVGGYDQALAQSVEAELFDLKGHVLSLDGLIAAKKAAGPLKDRNHLLELE
jgi:hypothetical protein